MCPGQITIRSRLVSHTSPYPRKQVPPLAQWPNKIQDKKNTYYNINTRSYCVCLIVCKMYLPAQPNQREEFHVCKSQVSFATVMFWSSTNSGTTEKTPGATHLMRKRIALYEPQKLIQWRYYWHIKCHLWSCSHAAEWGMPNTWRYLVGRLNSYQ